MKYVKFFSLAGMIMAALTGIFFDGATARLTMKIELGVALGLPTLAGLGLALNWFLACLNWNEQRQWGIGVALVGALIPCLTDGPHPEQQSLNLVLGMTAVGIGLVIAGLIINHLDTRRWYI